MASFKITKTQKTRYNDVNWENLKFGIYFSDHMFVSDYKDGRWDGGRIEPYSPMATDPAMCTLHYAQAIFEGLKAFRSVKGGANIFRPDMNAKRLNNSARMLCIPEFDEKLLIEAMVELVKLDYEFIPKKRGQSLYIRPFVFGTGSFLGVTASDTYRLVIITSPVASYFAEGLKPVKILVSTDYVRAVKGGLGMCKAAANYAASLRAGYEAQKKGFSQVLWLDGISRKYIDEVGAMNIMFVIGDELITPSLERGAILAGITRLSVLELARDWGMKVSEREISIDEVVESYKNGTLKEVFGTGTAAVISPVGLLHYKGLDMVINNSEVGPVAQKFYDTITGIQYGEIDDTKNWILRIDIS